MHSNESLSESETVPAAAVRGRRDLFLYALSFDRKRPLVFRTFYRLSIVRPGRGPQTEEDQKYG